MKNGLTILLFCLAISIGLMGQNPVPLKAGSKAPNSILKVINGKTSKISDHLKQNQKVLLCFMRPVWCPVCNHRTHELIENYSALKEKGYEVIVIYPTPANTLKGYVEELEIPFMVVSDFNEKLYNMYHIERSSRKIRAALVKKEGKRRMQLGRKLYNRKYTRKNDKHGPLVPADFVISSNRELLQTYYGEYMGDHLAIDQL